MYYSDYEIINVEDSAVDGCKRVELKNDKETLKIDIPEWELNVCTTKEPSTESDSRNSAAVYVVDELYKVIKKLDVRLNDIGFIIQKLLVKAEGEETKAVNEALGVNNSRDIRVKSHISKS